MIFVVVVKQGEMLAPASKEMCAYCFQVVERTLNRMPLAPLKKIPNINTPIFVTFKTLDRELRGCIGNFSSAPLHEQLQKYAKAAAFEDYRFSPIQLGELAQLVCTVSLLHSFEKIKLWDEWTVGIHGIQIAFRQYNATFLPEVAVEQGWDKKATMDSLIWKAGYRGYISRELLAKFEVVRYQVSSCSLSYKESSSLLEL